MKSKNTISLKDSQKKRIMKTLNTVQDPELGVGLVDLGLIYDVNLIDKILIVKMTLTSIGCPLAPMIIQDVQDAFENRKDIVSTEVEIVWEPPWTVEKMNPDVRAMLIGTD